MSRLPLVHDCPKHFCKAVYPVPGMETASPFTMLPEVTRIHGRRRAAGESQLSGQCGSSGTCAEVAMASLSWATVGGPDVLLRALPVRSASAITSRVIAALPSAFSVRAFSDSHLRLPKSSYQGEPCGAAQLCHSLRLARLQFHAPWAGLSIFMVSTGSG